MYGKGFSAACPGQNQRSGFLCQHDRPLLRIQAFPVNVRKKGIAAFGLGPHEGGVGRSCQFRQMRIVIQKFPGKRVKGASFPNSPVLNCQRSLPPLCFHDIRLFKSYIVVSHLLKGGIKARNLYFNLFFSLPHPFRAKKIRNGGQKIHCASHSMLSVIVLHTGRSLSSLGFSKSFWAAECRAALRWRQSQ